MHEPGAYRRSPENIWLHDRAARSLAITRILPGLFHESSRIKTNPVTYPWLYDPRLPGGLPAIAFTQLAGMAGRQGFPPIFTDFSNYYSQTQIRKP